MMRASSISQIAAFGAALCFLAGCAAANLGSPSTNGAPMRALSERSGSAPAPPSSALLRNGSARQPVESAAEKALIARLPEGSSQAKAGYAFVSDFPSQTIFVFTPVGDVAGVVTKDLYYPEGLATDDSANLYVANAGYSNVLVFVKPYQRTPTTYQDSGAVPSGVAVMPDGSLIGVTNIQSTNNGPGNVVFYKKGSTTPCATVSDPNWGAMFFGGFDSAGDLFIDGLANPVVGPPLVGEIKGGCNATGIQTLSTGNQLGKPGGIQVDRDGNVSIQDQSNSAIYTYAPPSNGSFGSPLSTTPLSGASDLVTFAFAPDEKYVVTGDAVKADVPVYAFPAGGLAVRTFTGPLSEPLGTAVIPDDR